MAHEIELLKPLDHDPIFMRQYPGYVQAGFPSPAADYLEEDIDLDSYLRPNPVSTFLVRCTGESMIESSIFPGSILIIDRSLALQNNKVVVAIVNGDMVLKHYVKNRSGIRLMPANKKFQPIFITEEMDFSIWGVATKIISSL